MCVTSEAMKNLYFLTGFLLVITFCRLLKTFPRTLDPNQTRQNVGPYLEPNFLTVLYSDCISEKKSEKNSFEKNQPTTKSMQN